ncbi:MULTISPECIES: HAMP domain-containing sensor histidine kinase [unclassified Streptomyces]|uniref:HAMP domain-containing sensor histidine kinase n=1 Tax=unclassified Streptomyces TaxID=2593676 RepID=UPI002DD95329|nr:HAMP domain-containing sensor histidine kinase [Streptomyces sp. NBC_01763]WSC40072.1 HAMP domain-containing histidine kinase [Streptomyces sp. NBC_01763]
MKVLGARFGLRTRLISAFLLVAAISAITTATLTYREARSAILQQAQDTAVAQFRDRVTAQTVTLPLDAAQLQQVCRTLAREGKPHTWIVFAEYADLRVSSSDRSTSNVITPELRAAARTNAHASFQRVVKNDEPWLTIGMPAMFDRGNGPQRTGLVLFAVMPLHPEEANVNAMVTAARDGALPALLIALVPALLAARSVLRPVRDLRRAAAGIGRGELDTRIEVKGSDELAELAWTFNESSTKLQQSVEELQRAEARARRFASDVSHELRTPLAGMLAVTEVLDEDAAHLNADTAAAVRLISAETGKLATLVDDLMEISRFDAKAAGLHLDEVDVAETIRKTLQARRWEEQVATELPDGIRGVLDPPRFDVIVANLVGNALRHGAQPVRVRLRTERREGEDWLVTEVEDSGPGIDPAVLPHIFDRFYKADEARTRSAGSGLGLAITQENVRLHGGTVHGANRPDGGAVFTVELPLEGA